MKAKIRFRAEEFIRKPHLLWMLAGLILSGLLSLTSISLAEAGKWTEKTSMPTARAYLSTSVVNRKIYAIGGYDGQRVFSTVEEYDPATDTWTKKASMPTARGGLSTSVVNGKIYAIGGLRRQGGVREAVAVVEEYDPTTDRWMKKASMPTARA